VSVSTPTDEGYWSGISETNFTVGHFARSLLEDVATEFEISINGCNKPVYLHGLNWSDPATEFGKTGADSKRSRTPF